MSCNCSKIKDLPTCLNELVIGTISIEDQQVYVFFTNTSLNQEVRLIGESDVDGLVTVDLTTLPDNYFSPNYHYEIHITDLDDSPHYQEPIEIGEESVFCLSIKFYRIENDALEAVYYDSLTAELA